MPFHAGATRPCFPIGDGGRTTDHYPCAESEIAYDRIGDEAARVIEINVHAMWANVLDLVFEFVILIIEGCVITELLDAPFCLFVSAGDPDGAAPMELRYLPCRRSYRSASR